MDSQRGLLLSTGTNAELDDLLEELGNRLQAGEHLDLEEVVAQHPQHADDLRRYFPSLQVLAGLKHTPEQLAVLGDLGDFRLLHEVGRGGMGIVYEAEQISLRRRVALKVLPFAATMDPRHLQRFHNEARAAAGLHHAHIVPVYFVGCERSVHFYAMQYIEGKSLAELIAAQRHPSPSEAVSAPGSPSAQTQPLAAASTQATPRDGAHFRRIAEWGIQAAEALEYAHSLGIVHRDIKPSNLMIDAAGKLWVTDFGLARTATEAGLTMTGDVVGTLRYMSPEQALAKHDLVDHRSDIYSLGATLYELLTLRPVVDGKDREEILRKITFEEPPSLRSLDRAILADLETIVLKALAKEPDERYATAQELADDLGRWLRREPIRARPIGRLTHLWRWCRRNPLLAVATGLIGTLFLAVVFVSVSFALYQVQAAREIDEKQKQTAEALEQSEQNSLQALRESASLALDRGLSFCEQGEIGIGLLWLARSLDIASRAKADDLEWAIRVNLSGWHRHLNPLQAVLAQDGPVLAVAFTPPDGRTILTGSEDGTVRYWDADTGKRLTQKIAHPGGVRALALSPDGQTLATVSADAGADVTMAEGGYTGITNRSHASGTIRFWETATAKALGPPLPAWGRILALAFSPDGQILATACADRTVRLRQTRTGELLGEEIRCADIPWVLAFRPDGKALLTGDFSDNVQVWEVATGKRLWSCPRQGAMNFAAAFSPDSRLVLTGGSNRIAQLWQTATGETFGSPLRHGALVSAAAFSPDGQNFVTGSYDHTARLRQTATGKPLGQPLLHRGYVQSVAFGRNGRTLVTGNWDGTARIWQVAAGEPPGTSLEHPGAVTAAAFSSDGRSVVTGCGNGTVLGWDAATGRPIGKPFPIFAEINKLVFSPDDRFLLTHSLDRTARLWEAATGKILRVIPSVGGDFGGALAFAPGGQCFLTSYLGDEAHLWETATGKSLRRPIRHGSAVTAAAFSPDGRFVLTGGSNNIAQLWEAATGQPIGEPLLHQGLICSVAFSADARTLLTASWDGTVHRWYRLTGGQIGRPFQQHPGVRAEPILGPDGRTFLVVFGDATARLGDAVSGRFLGAPLRHYGGMNVIAFSPDARAVLTIASNTDFRTARLWQVPVPLKGPIEQIRCWTELSTGLELDDDGLIHVLDAATWQQRRLRLQELGGPPETADLPHAKN